MFFKIIFANLLFFFTFMLSMANAQENNVSGQIIAVPFDKCKPEKGVSFQGNDKTRLKTSEIKKRLIGNTLLSVDRYGTFAIYYLASGEAVSWMPKKAHDNYSWTTGKVSFENDQYCRTWLEWKSGKKLIVGRCTVKTWQN